MGIIKYYSTNLKAPATTFRQAVLKGLAPDGGLYLPETIPLFRQDEIADFKSCTYADIASRVLGKFLDAELEPGVLEDITQSAYNFSVPIERVSDRTFIMRLDRGPTASFKDFATGFLGRLINYFLTLEDKDIVILTATSGDTGSAVANAFHGLSRVRVVVLFPEREVSELQRLQMTTLGGNVYAVAVDGKFDDCQLLAKRAFNDSSLARTGLSSANSINIGRLLPQTVYYFYAWSRIARGDSKLIFSVPSGNFGNLMGGVIAKSMGLPLGRFIVGVNDNDEFPVFLENGSYTPVSPSKNCLSSAMNVGHPSNLARLISLFGGQMDQHGSMISKPDMSLIRTNFISYSVSDSETIEVINRFYRTYGSIIEPHGAVAWAGLENSLRDGHIRDEDYCVVLETAHPAKFVETVKNALGIEPCMPESLLSLRGKTENYASISTSYDMFRDYLMSIIS